MRDCRSGYIRHDTMSGIPDSAHPDICYIPLFLM
jgi:hypothetical protein